MSEPNLQSRSQPNRRKRKFLLPDLQLKIVFVTLSVALIVLAVNFQLDLLAFGRVYNHPPPTLDQMFHALRDTLIQQFFYALAFAVPIALWVGIVYSFKFCGPIYSLQKDLRQRVDGQWDKPFALRKGDALQDLKDAIGASHVAMCQSLERQNELLLRAARFIRENEDAAEEIEVARLLDEIDEQSREHARHFEKAVSESAASPVQEKSLQA